VTADAVATIAWIAPGPADAEQARTLASWGRARGVRLVPPREDRAPALAVDPKVADDVDALLDRARDALAARDADAVDRSLGAAESTLRAHPELPQAAWLMAEVERVRALRLRRLAPVDADAAEKAWERAEAIDGGRVAGVGEQSGTAHPAPATIALDVAPAAAGRWLDGVEASGGALATHAGLHTLVVTWEGAPVWAAWLDTPAGSSAVHVVAPAAPPCSADDVRHARVTGDVLDATGVRCPSWVAAAPSPEGVRVAVCEQDRCGPLLPWRAPVAWTWTPGTAEPGSGGRWPAWATWGIVGTAAAVVTVGVIAAAGGFKGSTNETQFVSGGRVVQ
jgi:hypothetical protein